MLVQNEQNELTRIYLYPFIADVSRNSNYSHNHYLVPFFKSLIQALHAYRAKGKVSKSKMAELFLFRICEKLFFIYIYHFNFLIHLKFSKEQEEEGEEEEEEEEGVGR